ncbi:unnamed protein product [Lactuca saligna]|uniref:Uncharacterized protein n=1 Tax=Lactuca saligna TaxID=75948 RepID=A0AA35VI78_LACSI|nr:unnamed protein product [Lactuca saligna]
MLKVRFNLLSTPKHVIGEITVLRQIIPFARTLSASFMPNSMRTPISNDSFVCSYISLVARRNDDKNYKVKGGRGGGGSRDGSWRQGAALVAPSLILSSFSDNISQRWRQRETYRRNTTGKGCLAVAVRPEGRETKKRRVVALFLLLENHPPPVTKLINCYLVTLVLSHKQNM